MTHTSALGATHRPMVLAAPPGEFYREIVEGMTCGVLTVNRDGLITTLNEHAGAILDLNVAGVVGRPCEEALAHCPRLAQLLLESFSMSCPPSRDEMEIRTHDQRERTIGFSISKIGSPTDGAVLGAALFFKDLTKVEEQEERERLRDRLAALGQMAAQMAHEIRNPLTSIQVSASLMRRRLASRGEPTDFLEKITKEVCRIEATVANCLEFARPLSPVLTRTEPIGMLEEAIALARQRSGSDGVSVERAWQSGLPTLLCDRNLIQGSLTNILVNAYEAMAGRGRITVEAETAALRAPELAHAGRLQAGERTPRDGAPPAGTSAEGRPAVLGPMQEGFLVIRVSDTGPGIAPEVLERMFHPFFTTKASGSGIGLATARKVLEAHGGLLDVTSEQGHGASFTLKIPLAAGPAGNGA